MPDGAVTKDSLDRLEARFSEQIRDIYNRLNENSESIVKLETWYNTLVKLPDTMASLEKAILKIDHNMEAMATRMDTMADSIQSQRTAIESLKNENQAQDERISSVDNKSKVDWAKAITQNFWKVILAICGVIVAYKSLTGA